MTVKLATEIKTHLKSLHYSELKPNQNIQIKTGHILLGSLGENVV